MRRGEVVAGGAVVVTRRADQPLLLPELSRGHGRAGCAALGGRAEKACVWSCALGTALCSFASGPFVLQHVCPGVADESSLEVVQYTSGVVHMGETCMPWTSTETTQWSSVGDAAICLEDPVSVLGCAAVHIYVRAV